jgi:hypothetical protein
VEGGGGRGLSIHFNTFTMDFPEQKDRVRKRKEK